MRTVYTEHHSTNTHILKWILLSAVILTNNEKYCFYNFRDSNNKISSWDYINCLLPKWINITFNDQKDHVVVLNFKFCLFVSFFIAFLCGGDRNYWIFNNSIFNRRDIKKLLVFVRKDWDERKKKVKQKIALEI